MQAILSRQRAETLSSVLYPDDRTYQGKELRLKQQHFFVSATIQVGSPLPALAWSCLMVLRFGFTLMLLCPCFQFSPFCSSEKGSVMQQKDSLPERKA